MTTVVVRFLFNVPYREAFLQMNTPRPYSRDCALRLRLPNGRTHE